MRSRTPRRERWIGKLAWATLLVLVVAGVATPAWTDYARLARRGAAIRTLEELRERQASWRTNNPSFSNSLLPDTDASNDYTFTIPTATATHYVLRAVANGDQAGDTGCTTLEIEFDAGKLIRRPDPDTPNCWRRN